jgi:hypothetical protein
LLEGTFNEVAKLAGMRYLKRRSAVTTLKEQGHNDSRDQTDDQDQNWPQE